jgi:MOSC domain-containing protein YiiM
MESVMSRVVQIFIAPAATAPMEARDAVRAVAGSGIAGDRYGNDAGSFSPKVHKPDYEITLIELENVEEFARDKGVAFTAAKSRRNIVTEGVRLNDLVDKEFTVGEVRLRGIRLCEPCRILARTSAYEVLPALNGKAGLRAEVLNDGVIAVGDSITC